MSNENSPKKPFSCRIQSKNLKRLHELAEESKQTVSSLVDQAVDEFLNRQPVSKSEETYLNSDDIGKLAIIVGGIGNSVPLTFLLEIIKLYQNSKSV